MQGQWWCAVVRGQWWCFAFRCMAGRVRVVTSIIHHLDAIARNKYLGASNVVHAMLSMESSVGKKMELTFEPTCVCYYFFLFSF
jgi:hypothetical protein